MKKNIKYPCSEEDYEYMNSLSAAVLESAPKKNQSSFVVLDIYYYGSVSLGLIYENRRNR